MRNAVHQITIDLLPSAADFLSAVRHFHILALAVNRCFALQNLPKQHLRLANPGRNRHLQDPFSIKPLHLHIFIRRNNNSLRRSDFLRRQHIFRTAAPVGFHLNGNAHLARLVFQTFRRHEGMRNPRRAGSHRQNVIIIFLLFRSLRKAFFLLYA